MLTGLGFTDLNIAVTQPMNEWCDKLSVAPAPDGWKLPDVKLPEHSLIEALTLEFMMAVEPQFLAMVVEKRRVAP